MSNSLMKFSSRGAFSYHWNKGIDNDNSYLIRLVKSVVGFFQGLFCGYAVSEDEITSLFNDDNHKGSICYKEYSTRLGNRKAERVNDSGSEEQSINEKISENNAKNTAGSEGDKQKTLKIKTAKATKSKEVSVKKPSIDKLEELMNDKDFKSSDKHFSKDNLKLLGADDALRLFNRALELASSTFKDEHSDIAYRLLSEIECDKAFADFLYFEKENALCFFASCGDLNRLESLLSVGKHRMRGSAFCGDGAMTVAADSGNLDCIRLLLKKGANVDSKSINYGHTPLYVAVLKGDEECLQLLLNAGANANTLNQGFTPLYQAVLNGHIGCFNRLMKIEGIDVNKLGSRSKETPLECACRIASKECLVALLAHPNINKSGMSLLSIALNNNCFGCLELLLLDNDVYIHEATVNNQENMPIAYVLGIAIPLPYLKTFLCAHALDLNERASYLDGRATLLHLAAMDHWGLGIEMLNELLSYDIIRNAINDGDYEGLTALHYATSNSCSIEVLRALLAVPNIYVNVMDEHMFVTPLTLLNKYKSSPNYEECKFALEQAALKQENAYSLQT